ncbi:MAG: RodZ domain-containing protein [Alphaproteobacteria bacterium]
MIEEVARASAGVAREAPASVAARLGQERRKQGFSLADVAEAIRIRESYVAAIEGERFHELPGPAYALGFVGAYAQFLDLDRRAIVARFREEVGGADRASELKFLVPLKDGRFPGRAILAASLALAIAVYGGWYAYSHRDTGKPVAAAPAPATVKPSDQAKPRAQVAKTSTKTLPPHLPALAKTSDDTGLPGLAKSRPAAKQKAAAGPEKARKPVKVRKPIKARKPVKARKKVKAPRAHRTRAAKPPAPTSGRARIVLKAHQDTWVRIRLADGTKVISRILKAGERYSVLKNRGMVLTAGNAGGLRIIVDGRTLPPLGPRGVIRKGIRLDADALLASR